MLCQSQAELLTIACIERAKVSADSVGLRDVPYTSERVSLPAEAPITQWLAGSNTVRSRSNRPAAAVIPAPLAYIKVVAVKKLVVEPWAGWAGPPHRVHLSRLAFPSEEPHALHWACGGIRTFTVKKLECSKQALARIV
jgi:hypothetical protein